MVDCIELSICIVTWNSRNIIKKCLEGIINQCKKIKFEIIVIDNNSTDETVSMIENEFRDIILLKNQENLGFAKAHNMGIKRCRGNYILILNPDILITENSFGTMINYMNADESIGVLGCKLRNKDGSTQDSYNYNFPTLIDTLLVELFKKKYFKPTQSQNLTGVNKIIDVGWISGACMLFRSELLKKILFGFDEIYYMYCEDVDICRRIIKKGYRVCYTNETELIHFSGESSIKQKRNYFAPVLQRESVYKYLAKNRSLIVAIFYRFLWSTISFLKMFVLIWQWLFYSSFRMREKKEIGRKIIKNYRIMTWSMGFEKWVKRDFPR